ncbi:hypothetical protein ACQEV2_00300 [Streptomyces sp. CA-251387]|uniref:hypothetical protein n=1 Tax=Streptomyces sp. CA-251387 TaxID=3240064 RepID=UPI003D9295A3
MPRTAEFLAATGGEGAREIAAVGNRSKADHNSTWPPQAPGYRCTHATDWVSIRARRQLTVDPAEQTALTDILADCPNAVIKVTLAG